MIAVQAIYTKQVDRTVHSDVASKIGSSQPTDDIIPCFDRRVLALHVAPSTTRQTANLRTEVRVAEERDGLPGGGHVLRRCRAD